MSEPARSWADIVEAYRPAVMKARKRAPGCPKVSAIDDLETVIVGNESYYGAAIFGESPGDRVPMILNEMTGPSAAGFNMVARHRKDSFAPTAHSSRAASRKPRCWRTTEDKRSVQLMAARTHHFDHTGEVARRQPEFVQIMGIQSGQRDSECESSNLEGS